MKWNQVTAINFLASNIKFMELKRELPPHLRDRLRSFQEYLGVDAYYFVEALDALQLNEVAIKRLKALHGPYGATMLRVRALQLMDD